MSGDPTRVRRVPEQREGVLEQQLWGHEPWAWTSVDPFSGDTSRRRPPSKELTRSGL